MHGQLQELQEKQLGGQPELVEQQGCNGCKKHYRTAAAIMVEKKHIACFRSTAPIMAGLVWPLAQQTLGQDGHHGMCHCARVPVRVQGGAASEASCVTTSYSSIAKILGCHIKS